jgi:hypothetical protein
MTEDRNSEPTRASRLVVLAVGFIILMLLLLPPVRGLLNRVPYIWDVLYPLLMVFAGYLVVTAALACEPILSVMKWVLLLVAAACMTGYVYAGAPIFFTVGQWSAMLFMAAEVVHVIIETLHAPAHAGEV